MNPNTDNWPALSFLEGLRPGPDESVELALLAFYSADLGSVGATLLALAGKDNDGGRGSPSDFADAVECLRGKVRIVIQRGRLANMRRTPRIASVLDQFVREVDFDEAQHSWHPKVALLRTRSAKGELAWRLWIGSRNLTECANRDIGLMLVSAKRGGAPVAGADELARALAERAGLKGHSPAKVAAAVEKVAWKAPAGVQVERICWMTGSGDQPLPMLSPGTEEIVVISPFVDKTFLSRLRVEGKKPRRVLLTTMREIERIGPALGAFDQLLALDAPDYPPADQLSEPQVTATELDNKGVANGEEEELGLGLHAKLLFVRSGQKRRLWLGSANATMRAWTGRNVEVVAELRISEPVERGLKALLGSAKLCEAIKTEYTPEEATLEEEALERARAQVSARWASRITIDVEGVHITQEQEQQLGGPHPDELDITLEVGMLHGDLINWPAKQATVLLGAAPLAECSELVRLRVSRGGKGLSWLQRAPSTPSLGEERDRAAFVRLLGARGFLIWLAGLLADDGREGEGDWTNEVRREPSGAQDTPMFDAALPTLEEMLAAWARDAKKFREIEQRVSQYLPAVLVHAEREEPEAAEMLKRFDDLWRKLRIGLGTAPKGASR